MGYMDSFKATLDRLDKELEQTRKAWRSVDRHDRLTRADIVKNPNRQLKRKRNKAAKAARKLNRGKK